MCTYTSFFALYLFHIWLLSLSLSLSFLINLSLCCYLSLSLFLFPSLHFFYIYMYFYLLIFLTVSFVNNLSGYYWTMNLSYFRFLMRVPCMQLVCSALLMITYCRTCRAGRVARDLVYEKMVSRQASTGMDPSYDWFMF